MALEWFTQKLQQWKGRRGVRSPFGRHVSPEVIRRLLEERGDLVGPRATHFQFIVVLACDTNPQEVPEILGTVVNALIRHRTTITGIEASLVVVLLAAPFQIDNSPEARRTLVDALLQESGDRIRIAHGECDGLVGNIGGDARKSYTGVIPGFSSVLREILEAKPGTAVEIVCEPVPPARLLETGPSESRIGR